MSPPCHHQLSTLSQDLAIPSAGLGDLHKNPCLEKETRPEGAGRGKMSRLHALARSCDGFPQPRLRLQFDVFLHTPPRNPPPNSRAFLPGHAGAVTWD